MIKPNCWKLNDYIRSLHEWTQENESKNAIFYYFPITSLDIAEQMELVKREYDKNTPVINLLWMMLDNKRKKNGK